MNNEELELDDGRLIYTVSQISEEIKTILEGSYPLVWLRGEVSNYKLYNSGHAYFSLKDEESQINAVKFAAASTLKFDIENGMEVLVSGHVSSYPKRGDYQIIISSIEPYGQGDLAKKFEELKHKLDAEGLFDDKYKKPIPRLINKIGIVTSQDGAALRDILKVLDSLNASADVLISPARVQGKEAEIEIPKAIEFLNANYPDLDVLLVGRGGGSIEDLWAFNTEPVARAVFNSKIPVISCVGHETDVTIADFVADLRAATPSAAAEIATRGKSEIENEVENSRLSLAASIKSIFEAAKAKFEKVATSRAFTKPYLIYEDKIAYIDELGERIKNLIFKSADLKLQKLESVSHKLDLVSPLNVLGRGFAICKNSDGKIIKDAATVKAGDVIDVKLSKGEIKAITN